MVHALLGAIPTLAAAAATAAHATDAGDFVCGVRTARAEGSARTPGWPPARFARWCAC